MKPKRTIVLQKKIKPQLILSPKPMGRLVPGRYVKAKGTGKKIG